MPIPTRPDRHGAVSWQQRATTNVLVLGTHFVGTSAGRILWTVDGYRFAPHA